MINRLEVTIVISITVSQLVFSPNIVNLGLSSIDYLTNKLLVPANLLSSIYTLNYDIIQPSQ